MNIELGKPIGAIFLLVASSFFTTANAATVSCGTTGGLEVGDVTFRGASSDGCGGIFNGNDSLTEVNLGANNLLFGGTSWTDYLKDDAPGDPSQGNASFFGVNWTLGVESGTDGAWTLTVADPLPADLPVTIDFLAVLKGSDTWAAYFFDDETFSVEGSSDGAFTMRLEAGNNMSIADISHLTLYARAGTPPPPPPTGNVPEPNTMALLGLGIFGIGFMGRRKKHS